MTGIDGFSGAKVALLCENKVVTYLRDDSQTIPFPGHWDLAGGGRENNETPEQCVLREAMEEFGLKLRPERIAWKRRYPNATTPTGPVYFMVVHLEKTEVSDIKFGNEGQFWRLMDIQEFLKNPKAIPQLQARLGCYLSQSQ